MAYFISIYFYTSSYTFWSWIHDSVVSFCYSSFLFNFQYGMVLYSWQSIIVAVKKRPVTKSYTRLVQLRKLLRNFLQMAIHSPVFHNSHSSSTVLANNDSRVYINAVDPGTCSTDYYCGLHKTQFLMLPFIIQTIFCAFCCKSNPTSEHEAVRNAKCIMLWNIPGLLLTMSDVAGQIYLSKKSK